MASSRMLRDLAIQPYIGFGSGYQGRGYPSRSDYVQHAQSPATGSFVADIRVRRHAALGRESPDAIPGSGRSTFPRRIVVHRQTSTPCSRS
jgi:hypothetical protein